LQRAKGSQSPAFGNAGPGRQVNKTSPLIFNGTGEPAGFRNFLPLLTRKIHRERREMGSSELEEGSGKMEEKRAGRGNPREVKHPGHWQYPANASGGTAATIY